MNYSDYSLSCKNTYVSAAEFLEEPIYVQMRKSSDFWPNPLNSHSRRAEQADWVLLIATDHTKWSLLKLPGSSHFIWALPQDFRECSALEQLARCCSDEKV